MAVVIGRKKRKLLWIGGALVVAVALSAAGAFLIDYSSTDARIDRAVAQIVAEYGFERQIARVHVVSGSPDRPQMNDVGTHYRRAPVDTETEDEIVAILREACPSCHYVQLSGGDHWIEVYSLRPRGQDGGWSAWLAFSPGNKGFGRPDIEPTATLSLSTFRPSLWQRIKGLWPW